MKKLILGMLLSVMVGCGGGGSSPVVTTPAKIISKIDGNYSNTSGQNPGGNFKLFKNVSFGDGKITTISSSISTPLSISTTKTGTFSLNGEILTYTLTDSTTSIWDPLSHPSTNNLFKPPSDSFLAKTSNSPIYESVTCTATLSGGILTLKDSQGNIETFK